jgi:hypothetical protein
MAIHRLRRRHGLTGEAVAQVAAQRDQRLAAPLGIGGMAGGRQQKAVRAQAPAPLILPDAAPQVAAGPAGGDAEGGQREIAGFAQQDLGADHVRAAVFSIRPDRSGEGEGIGLDRIRLGRDGHGLASAGRSGKIDFDPI